MCFECGLGFRLWGKEGHGKSRANMIEQKWFSRLILESRL